MWKRVMRSCDEVSGIMKHGRKLLDVETETESRHTDIEPEICSWRAHVRHSQILKVKVISICIQTFGLVSKYNYFVWNRFLK